MTFDLEVLLFGQASGALDAIREDDRRGGDGDRQTQETHSRHGVEIRVQELPHISRFVNCQSLLQRVAMPTARHKVQGVDGERGIVFLGEVVIERGGPADSAKRASRSVDAVE